MEDWAGLLKITRILDSGNQKEKRKGQLLASYPLRWCFHVQFRTLEKQGAKGSGWGTSLVDAQTGGR